MDFFTQNRIIYIIAINIIAFIAFGLDKHKAKKRKWRIPESTLMLLSALGGSIGAIIGMKIFHHKSRHPKFSVGIPMLLIVQLLIIVFLIIK